MISQGKIKAVLLNPYLLLFVITLIYYSLYLSHVFLNLNTLLSHSIDDSLKNYYTYVYQIKNSPSLLHFDGFNYPFGEHVVYTDCQPLLTFILRQLPFAYNYSIGILHFIVFFTILICPLIYLSIFRMLKFPHLTSFALSLAITILSPQYFRIYCGHYALTYACVIPLTMLLLLRYFQFQKPFTLITLFIYNSLLFLIHPYYGLGISLFCFFSLSFMTLFQKGKRLMALFQSLLIGIVPIVLFRLFMLLSDQHAGRSPEPFGNTILISELSSFLVPVFGPFSQILIKVFGAAPAHFEGYSYLGLGLILLLIPGIPLLLFFYRKIKPHKGLMALLIASLIFLWFSFGFQYNLQAFFGFKIQALNQFRAMGRFSWFIYYILPLILFYFLYELFKQKFSSSISIKTINTLALFYLAVNLYEADAYYKMFNGEVWKDRNIFNPQELNAEEKHLIETIKEKKAEAIIPLPTFYVGSEVYERSYPYRPMFLSTMFSYHCGLPIQSACMSRTSVSETQAGINLLNSYKRLTQEELKKGSSVFFVIRTLDYLYEDEKRVWKITQPHLKNDSTAYGFITHKDLHSPILDVKLLEIKSKNHYPPDSLTVVSLAYEKRKPFLPANALNYEMIYKTDTNTIKSGSYIVSFHYHTNNKTYLGQANAFIVAKKRGEEYNWQEFISPKIPSGFSNGYSIIERQLEIDGRYAYEFFMHGGDDFEYTVRNFMLRPANTSVRVITEKNDTLYNNFPR